MLEIKYPWIWFTFREWRTKHLKLWDKGMGKAMEPHRLRDSSREKNSWGSDGDQWWEKTLLCMRQWWSITSWYLLFWITRGSGSGELVSAHTERKASYWLSPGSRFLQTHNRCWCNTKIQFVQLSISSPQWKRCVSLSVFFCVRIWQCTKLLVRIKYSQDDMVKRMVPMKICFQDLIWKMREAKCQ